jgi:hypothetical protein
MVTGHGAGFVMCWQNDVQLSLAEDVDPRNFLVVNSGSYVLAIPDLAHYARHDSEPDPALHNEDASSVSSYRQLAIFKKTVMKLNGNVRWVAGLVFERDLDHRGRSFDFIPHYDVVLKNPQYAKSTNGKVSVSNHPPRSELTYNRPMMHSAGSEATIYTCLSPLLPPMTENGQLQTSSRQKHTTAFISLLDFSLISTIGGPCFRAPCLFQYDRAGYGQASKSQAKSLVVIWQLSSIISYFRHYT